MNGWRAEGVPDSGIVVLGRVNSMLLPVLAALDDAGVGTRSVLGSPFMHRNLVRATLAWMRLARRPDSMDHRDLNEAVRRPGRRINRLARELLEGSFDVSLEQLAALGADLNERHRDTWQGFVADVTAASRLVAGGCDTRTLVDFLMSQIGLGRAAGSLDSGRTRPDRATHADDLLALRRTAAVYSDPAGFGTQLAGLLRRTTEDGDGVLLTSIHRVKGLEWDRVLVFAADETLMPHQLAVDIEEERRVLHVAVTRARCEAVVLADERKPSPFLNELEGRPSKPEKREPRSERTTLLEAIRGPKRRGTAKSRTPQDDAPYDEVLFETLRGWRREESRRRKVPAYVVFDDRTLKSVARRKPTTDFDLAAVSGVGPKKMADYGEAVVAMVRAHISNDPADSGTSPG